jgi:hypothetical protein
VSGAGPASAGGDWVETLRWLERVPNGCEVLPGDARQGEAVLRWPQVSRGSLLGCVAAETAGLLFDDGWLRLLGSGSRRLNGNLLSWNVTSDGPRLGGAFLVAHDAVGGFFALNGGMLPGKRGEVFYQGPDTLDWRSLGGGYSHLFSWAATGDLGQFYRALRWPGWRREVAAMAGDRGVSLADESRRAVPMEELWDRGRGGSRPGGRDPGGGSGARSPRP